MAQVTFSYKNGRERVMGRREAEILRRLGHGTYMTRDMRAAPAQSVGLDAPQDANARPVVSPSISAGSAPTQPKAKRKYTRKAKSK